MEVRASSIGEVFVIFALLFTISLPATINAQSPSPSPSPLVGPVSTSDGTAIDQGIAYVLMLLALVVTYMIH